MAQSKNCKVIKNEITDKIILVAKISDEDCNYIKAKYDYLINSNSKLLMKLSSIDFMSIKQNMLVVKLSLSKYLNSICSNISNTFSEEDSKTALQMILFQLKLENYDLYKIDNHNQN
jgi:iron only hydrogenase large subunit-like protein